MSEARNRTLLLVDDEDSVLSALKRLFRRDGYRILTAPSGPDALGLLKDNEVDVIISDQRMPGMTGVDFMRQAKLLRPGTIRMTLSGYTDLQSIIDAVNEGAVFKFLTKPWDDERLRDHVAKAFRHKEMADENRRLTSDLSQANSKLADVNQRLEHLLVRQKEQAQLVQTSAGGLREIVDQLPAALLGIDPEGTLVFMNQLACTLMPDAMGYLGGEPGGELATLLQRLASQPSAQACQTVRLAHCPTPVRVWRQTLSSPSARRGELLMLLPWPQEVPA
ncbi:MAG: response regulator [Burkholderiales bacterium]|nr:response regulator [Burkholderiales bacterium]